MKTWPVIAIDGLDGLRTACDVPKLLHRKTTGKGSEGREENYAKTTL